jgi:broad specificity polyphosphatase/5'/3'-nucleotidase SurE
VGNFSEERVCLGQELSSELAYLSLNYNVPHEELEAYLNSNGTISNVDIPEQYQDDTANYLTPLKEKGSKKKKKEKKNKKEMNTMQFSPSHSSYMHLGPDQQTHMVQTQNFGISASGRKVKAHDRQRRK